MDYYEDLLVELSSNSSISHYPGHPGEHATTLAAENIGQLQLRTRLLYLIIALFGVSL